MLVAVAATSLLWRADSATANPGTVLIRNATLVTPAHIAIDVDLIVEGGRIREIGSALSHPQARVFDATGKFVLPGLIDCHTHLNSVPGAALRGDDARTIAAARKTQLRAYLAAGVTTVLDAAAPTDVLTRMRAYVEATNLGPRIEGLAPTLTPEGGYFAADEVRVGNYEQLVPPIGDDLQPIDEYLREAAALSPVGVKVTVEDGFGPSAVWPIFDAAALAHIKASARAHGAPIFVHAMEPEAYVHALPLEPHAFVHAPISPLDAEQLQAVKASGATVITTVAVADMTLLIHQTERMDDPWMRRLVPPEQRATAASAEHSNEMLSIIVEQNAPSWMPSAVIRWLVPWLSSPSQTISMRDGTLEAVKALYDADIPLVMGADMGNWPVFTSLFHGVGSIREMELLEQAGIPRPDVLAAATTRAAALIGQGDRIGALEIGMRADLLVANQNPLAKGMQSLRDLAWVMKAGEMRTPQEWMTGP